MSNKMKLDNFGKLALICCMFSLCTTKPITSTPALAVEVKPDRVDLLLMKVDQIAIKEESLSSALNIAIASRKKRVPELRPLRVDTILVSTHPFGPGFEY